MPIPKPTSGEDKSKYMGRCMNFLKNENKFEQKQKVAICLNNWNRNNEAVVSADVEKNLAKGHVDVIGGTTKKRKKKKKKEDEEDLMERIDNYINEK